MKYFCLYKYIEIKLCVIISVSLSCLLNLNAQEETRAQFWEQLSKDPIHSSVIVNLSVQKGTPFLWSSKSNDVDRLLVELELLIDSDKPYRFKSVALTLRGDLYVQKGMIKEAADCYVKARSSLDNQIYDVGISERIANLANMDHDLFSMSCLRGKVILPDNIDGQLHISVKHLTQRDFTNMTVEVMDEQFLVSNILEGEVALKVSIPEIPEIPVIAQTVTVSESDPLNLELVMGTVQLNTQVIDKDDMYIFSWTGMFSTNISFGMIIQDKNKAEGVRIVAKDINTNGSYGSVRIPKRKFFAKEYEWYVYGYQYTGKITIPDTYSSLQIISDTGNFKIKERGSSSL